MRADFAELTGTTAQSRDVEPELSAQSPLRFTSTSRVLPPIDFTSITVRVRFHTVCRIFAPLAWADARNEAKSVVPGNG